jgi:LPXTG-motif cell wall-anchored protein
MHLSFRLAGAILVTVALLLGGAIVAWASPPAAAPIMFLAKVGGSLNDTAVQADLYLPGTITIDEGDSITWADAAGADESHTVTFGATGPCVDLSKLGVPSLGTSYSGTGCVSSGSLWPAAAPASAGPKSYTLTFPKAGTYQYFCQFHKPAMTGAVVVQPAGSPYPAGQAAYDATKDPALAAAEKAGEAALAAQTVTSRANSDGTTTYTMNAGYGDGKSFSLYRYGANNLSIGAGDSVVWVQNDVADFHTVTFLDNGKDVPFALPTGYPNPAAVSRTPDTSYTGSGFVNSGLLVPAPAPADARTYRLTFPRAGTYSYECLIHDDAGMKGTIQVAARLPQVLPRTGDISAAIFVATGLAGLSAIGGGLALYRRSRSLG